MSVTPSDLVRLTDGNFDLQDLVRLVQSNAARTTAIQLQAVVEATAALHGRQADIGAHIAAIVRNNPGADIAQTLSRPDVQQRLAAIAQRTDSAATTTIRGAHFAGYTAGRSQIRAEASALGLHLPPRSATSVYLQDNSPHLESVLSDLHANTAFMPARLQAAAASGFGTEADLDVRAGNLPAERARRRARSAQEVTEREKRRSSNRIAAGASVVANRASNEARIHELRELQAANPSRRIRKLWVCTFGGNTCGTCAAIHGTVLELDEEYNHEQTFVAGSVPAVYHDLAMPPRHPNCRCAVTLHVDSLGGTESLRADARAFADQSATMAPRSWAAGSTSDLARTTNFMNASDIRAMSDSQFDGAVGVFRACMGRRIL